MYVNAFQFRPRDFATMGILTLPQTFHLIGLTVLGGLTLGFAPHF